MRNILIAALGLATLTQAAFAKPICEERRDACYAEALQMADKSTDKVAAKSNCDADYDRCVSAISNASTSVNRTIVPTVPGLGAPMQPPNPTVSVAGNPATTTTARIQTNTKTINVKKSPPPATKGASSSPPAPGSASGSPSSSGSGSTSGGGGNRSGSSNGPGTRQN